MAKAYGSELLKKTAEQSFWNTFLAYPDPFEGLVYRRQSTQSTDVLARLGAAPMPEEWIGNAEVKDANEYSYSVENKAYISAVRVGKKLIKFEQWGEIANLTSNLGSKAQAHKAKLASSLLEDGFSNTGDDGQYFFDGDHKDPGAEYSTSQDNDLTSAITDKDAPTASEFATAVRSIIDAFYGFKDDRGDPFGDFAVENPNNLVIMVPPGFATVARQVLTADTLSSAGDNDLKGTFDLRVNRWLSNTDHFYGFIKSVSHKPIIVQEAGGIELTDSMGSADHTQTGDVVYASSWWGRVTYGQWRTAVGYIFTTA